MVEAGSTEKLYLSQHSMLEVELRAYFCANSIQMIAIEESWIWTATILQK